MPRPGIGANLVLLNLGFEFHRLLATVHAAATAFGYDKLGTAFGAQITFSCLIGHLDSP